MASENYATRVIRSCAGYDEKALDAYVEGDEKTGGKLVEQAKDLNEAAVRDVHQELEEDAVSEHNPAKLGQHTAHENQISRTRRST